MKLNKKIAILSTAALLAVAPVVTTGVNSSVSVQAASSSKVYKTDGKGTVTVTKKTNFYDKNGKKLSRTAAKGDKYIIWNVKTINGKLYFSIHDLKYWLPATATKGTVTYKDGSSTISYKTNGTNTIVMTSKTTSATNSSTSTTKKSSTTKVVKITMKRKAYVYDKNGKRVKNYYGTSYIGKGITVKGYGTKTINGTKYYALEPNKYYVKVSDIK